MNTLPAPALPGNRSTPAPTSNARVPGDIRAPILAACDAKHAAWRRLHAAQVEAACGSPDPAVLAAAAADNEAAELAFLNGKGDMAELAMALLRTVEADPSHPERVATAHRRHHEAQVDLACGAGNSLLTDEAEAEYARSVADAAAARLAKVEGFIEVLRLTAGDETGLREIAGRHSNAITGAVPEDMARILGDVILSARDTRRELNAQGIELLDAVNGVSALRAEVAKLQAAVKALSAAGIAVQP